MPRNLTKSSVEKSESFGIGKILCLLGMRCRQSCMPYGKIIYSGQEAVVSLKKTVKVRQVHLRCCCGTSLLIADSISFRVQHRLKINSSPKILQDTSARLGLRRHSALGTERL
ncbi:hypothetical protein STEG23_037837 [Scotinomys teguina]